MRVILSLLLLALAFVPAAAQMKCATPSIQVVDKKTLDLIVGSDRHDATVETTIVDIISRYPDADRVILQRDLISLVCETIANSPDVTFSEKAKLLIDITREIQSAFSKTSLLPFGESLLLLTRLNPSDLEFNLVMVSEATVYKSCKVNGTEVEYGDSVSSQYFLAYQRDLLMIIPDEFRKIASESGDFFLRIPKDMLFTYVDAGRQTLVYFERIPSGNCYAAIIKLYLGVWLRGNSTYLVNYKIVSVTAHGQCRIFIERVGPDTYVELLDKYIAFQAKKDWTRDYHTVGVDDAHKAFELSQDAIKTEPTDNALAVRFSMDAGYSPCMKTPLKKAVSFKSS